MSAMCVKVREQANMNRKEFAEWLGIPYRTMQDWERGVSEVPDYVLNLIAYKAKNEKEKGDRKNGSEKLQQTIIPGKSPGYRCILEKRDGACPHRSNSVSVECLK